MTPWDDQEASDRRDAIEHASDDPEPRSVDDMDSGLREAMVDLGESSDPGSAWVKQDIKASLLGTARPECRIGRYTLGPALGAGGMGGVFLGHDDDLDRPVALKLLHSTRDEQSPASRARMIREAQTLAKLSHPNVVQVYEVGEANGRMYIAMELIRGRSLRDWARTEPGWREVVERYMMAGRGLAAVHEAGLVHRDFKPDNVLLGDDGRVCVADFGLARGTAVPLPDEDERPSDEGVISTPKVHESPDPSARLTRTGQVIGTPAYMAPEQLRGNEVDARADQFAFCVSLYEGLYGQRPFGGKSVAALLEGCTRGIQAPSAATSVPRRVWHVLARGLAPRPEDRFSSMSALLRALDPARARRRRIVVGGVLGGALLLSAAVALRPRTGPTCEIDPTALADAWGDEPRERIRSTFDASGLSFSREAFAEAEAMLDGWGTRWLDARAAACRATHIEGAQSVQQLDARVACLERQRRTTATLARVLVEADRRIVAQADRVLARLPDVSACADPDRLDELHPLSADPETARAVTRAQERIAEGMALVDAGALARAEQVSAELQEEAERLAVEPLHLEAATLAGELLIARQDLDAAVPMLQDVAQRAEALRLDELVATVRVRLARAAVGQWSHPEREQWLLAEAQAATDRVGRFDDPRRLDLALARGRMLSSRGQHETAIEVLRTAAREAQQRRQPAALGHLTVALGIALQRLGRYDDARAELAHALASAEQRLGAGSPAAGNIHFDLGLLALEEGELDRAEQYLSAARVIYEQVFGAESIDAARARFAQVKLAMGRGALDDARTLLAEVLPVYERELGPGHVETAQVQNARGVLAYFAGDFAESIEAYQRALAVHRRVFGADHEDVGLMLSNIAESQLALGQPEAALASFDEALAIMRRALPEGHPVMALPNKGRGLALLALGRRDEAVDALERALAIHDAGSGEPIEHAETRFALAQALQGRDGPRARALARRAAQDFETLGLSDRLEAARRLLDDDNANEEHKEP